LPEQEADGLFLQLLLVFEAQAMVQLGKVVDPVSQEAVRHLDAARATIATIEMLERKTRGNLAGEEESFLKRVLTGLRMNYLDEVSKERRSDEEAAAEGTELGTESRQAPAEESASPQKESSGDSGDEAAADQPSSEDASVGDGGAAS
jgi:hypothetical protein